MKLSQSTILNALEAKFDFVKSEAREGILVTLEKLGNIPNTISPKFVFVHIITPHPPYVFGPNGEVRDDVDLDLEGAVWSKNVLYIDQVKFISKKIDEVIGRILAQDGQEPIIVLQSDHGPGGLDIGERMKILDAIYVPAPLRKYVYDDITPVNNFRLILKYLFDYDLELLDDKNLYSTYENPYVFTQIDRELR